MRSIPPKKIDAGVRTTNGLFEDSLFEESVTLTGDTYCVRGQLTALGARFDAHSRSWQIAKSSASAARALIPKSRSGTERLLCCVCGGDFNWLECVTIGWPQRGDSRGCWEENWCGCAPREEQE